MMPNREEIYNAIIKVIGDQRISDDLSGNIFSILRASNNYQVDFIEVKGIDKNGKPRMTEASRNKIKQARAIGIPVEIV